MRIENNKIRTGTVEPYGWVDNNFKNRFVKRFGRGWYYDCSWFKIICKIIEFPISCFYQRIVVVNYWRIRCLLGFHSERYLLNIVGEMVPFCAWCQKQTGKKFVPDNLNEYTHIINGMFYKKKK